MTEEKVRFTVSMSPKIASEIERARGDYSRSLIIEAMCMECLGLPESEYAEGRKHY